MHFDFSLRGLLTAFFRKKDIFVSIFSLVVLAGGLYLWHAPQVYESKGAFLIRLGQGALPSIGSADGKPAEYSRDDRDEIIQSDIMLLQSDDLLKEVIRTVGLEKIYPGITARMNGAEIAEQAAVIRLREKGLKVFADPKSNVIEISVLNGNPVAAQEIAAHLMEIFTARQSVIFGASQTAFLQQQADAMRKKMEQSQQDLRDFKQKEGITLLDEEIDQLLAEKRDLSVQALRSVSDSQAVVAKIQNDNAAMESTYLPDSPVMQRINHSLVVARAQMEAGNAGNNAFAARIAAIDKRLDFLETNRKHYDELQQRVTLDTENYKLYQSRNEEALVNDRLNQENITRVSIIDKPVVPLKPVAINKPLFIAAILMTALLLSAGIVLFLELLSDTVVFSEQTIAATGLPVLAIFEG
jgi:uncharacterized protein involved in exopolysaccharide biosynthesis